MTQSNFGWVWEDAKKLYEEGMNWIDFSNLFFEKGSKYMPDEEEEREQYLSSPEFEKVLDMKYKLEKQQSNLSTTDFSGKTVIRLPKSIHRDLTIIADKEGVSLNQMMVVFLSQFVVRYFQG